MLDSGTIDNPGMRFRNFPVLVDQDGQGHVIEPVQLGKCVVPDANRIVQFFLSQVGRDGLPTIFVHGETHNPETAGAVLLLELGEPRNLSLTAVTPGRPEVQKDHFAAVAGQDQRFAVLIFQGEGWCGLAIGCDRKVSSVRRRPERGGRKNNYGYYTRQVAESFLMHGGHYASTQKRSLRYLSPESQRIVTITAG